MDERTKEWFTQAEYDLDTARYMLKGDRRFYAVFMAHLCVEKALKGLWHERFGTPPPKTHNLLYLVEKVGVPPTREVNEFLTSLNDASVATRCPDDIKKMMAAFPRQEVQSMVEKTQEALAWLKSLL